MQIQGARRVCALRVLVNMVVVKIDRLTAKFNYQPTFSAIQDLLNSVYSNSTNLCFYMRFEL